VSLTVLLVQVLREVVDEAACSDIGEDTHDQRGDDDEEDDENGDGGIHCSCPFYVRATSVRLNKS
jgi:hypothetical protein